jgi:YbbR domain-containing protein
MTDKTEKRPSICIDLKKSRIRIHKETLRMLQNPDYIEILVNPKKKSFVIKTSSYRKNAHRVEMDRLTTDKHCYELYSREFMTEIQTVSKTLEHSKSYRITGTLNREKDAACFFLEQAVLIAPGKEGTYA